MNNEKYSTNTYSVKRILSMIENKEIAIPEIQRPFVWKNTQVRDLIDSLYRGYPAGYLITWKNHDVKLKDGTTSEGKTILIDGQQRVTALMASLLGVEVINQEYKSTRIKIAFNPEEAMKLYQDPNADAEIFAVQDSSHLKSSKWIADISTVFDNHFNHFTFVKHTARITLMLKILNSQRFSML
jgi:Protein of unknown function DUF262.